MRDGGQTEQMTEGGWVRFSEQIKLVFLCPFAIAGVCSDGAKITLNVSGSLS